MKKWILLLAAVFACTSVTCYSESASYGFRMTSARWKEKGLFPGGTAKAEGAMLGPTMLFRVGNNDEWSIGVDGMYGELDQMDRVDADLTATYNVSSLFGIFADFRYLWYDIDGKDDPDIGADVGTTGLGLGLGVSLNAPLGSSGMFFFANGRGMPMSMDTDVEDAGDNAFLWAYEGGFAYAAPLEIGAGETSIYLSLGYRHQQMKGGDFDETLQMPFAEIGFKQEF